MAVTRYGAVFAVREYRPMFVAHVISMLGTMVAEVALSVLVYRSTGSPFLTAATFAVGFVPYALGGTVLASIADRYPTRTVLVWCNLLSALLIAAMAVPGLPVAALLGLRFASATVAPVFGAARAASIPEIVPGPAAVLARSLIRVVTQSSQLVGFAVGGLLLVAVSPRFALAGEAAGFVLSALLLRLGTRWRPARGGTGRTMLGDSVHGLRAVFGAPRIRVLLALWWVPPVFAVAPEALAAPYAHGIGQGSVGLGLLMTAVPAGTVLGELGAGMLSARLRSRLVLPLASASLLPLTVFAVHPGLPVAVLALFGAGLCSAYLVGLDQWFLAAVPEQLAGRAMAVNSGGLMLGQAIGMAAAGAAAEYLAPHLVVVTAALLGLGATAATVHRVRRSATAPADRPLADAPTG
ncbi:MFS transporter [Actinocatenispora comari]|uniref:MFS transporter n=1 Tax=Actinocatenispora comari TaxID=2807577 RepID=A0A8J4EN45_9ACTN|nr:MFS transporter [Actinocatenispora comari]GIL29905.1 MFS transporter [Actinocatenispora comari]